VATATLEGSDSERLSCSDIEKESAQSGGVPFTLV